MHSVALRRFPQIEKLARRLVSLYPMSSRLGEGFWKWYAFFEESQGWALAALQNFQLEQVRGLLLRLSATSDFYSERLSGVDVSAIRSLEDFRARVPCLSRAEFARDYGRLRHRKFDARACQPSSTSGTTGSALEFFHPGADARREWAAICHQWTRVGFDPARSRRAEFRALTRDRQLFQSYPDQNMVRFSILDLRKQNLPAMADVIQREKLTFYHGYPSAFYLLAREVVTAGIRFPEPQAFLLASEMVYPFQVEEIQRAFPNAAVFAHYGCAERTVLAGWCEHRRAYHVLPQYSIAEVDSATREIIGTNLFNDVNGFVRYRMTDIAATVEPEPCRACGRPYAPVMVELEGRQEDYLFSPGNGWIPPAIVTYPLKHLHNIQELQIHQSERDAITVNYVLRSQPGSLPEELAAIEAGFSELLGRTVRVRFQQVDDLPRGRTGKYKWIVSKLDPPR